MEAPGLFPRGQFSLWLGGASLAFLIFFRITRELIGGDVSAFDVAIPHSVAPLRNPWLTNRDGRCDGTWIDYAAILFSIPALLILMFCATVSLPCKLLVASAGAAALTLCTKDMIERVRSAEAQQLIVVAGFSYPSGHSLGTSALYLTLAIIACRRWSGIREKTTIFVAVSSIVVLVGVSRVYLGVHYLTDVVIGISLGAAWALLLAGVVARIGGKARRVLCL